MLDHQPSAETTALIHERFLPSDSRSVQDDVTVVYLLWPPCSSKRSALRGMKPGPKPGIASCRCSTLFPNGPQSFLTFKKEDLMLNRASGQAAFLAAKLRNQTKPNIKEWSTIHPDAPNNFWCATKTAGSSFCIGLTLCRWHQQQLSQTICCSLTSSQMPTRPQRPIQKKTQQ
jgi:hypothetical protein